MVFQKQIIILVKTCPALHWRWRWNTWALWNTKKIDKEEQCLSCGRQYLTLSSSKRDNLNAFTNTSPCWNIQKIFQPMLSHQLVDNFKVKHGRYHIFVATLFCVFACLFNFLHVDTIKLVDLHWFWTHFTQTHNTAPKYHLTTIWRQLLCQLANLPSGRLISWVKIIP